MEEDAELREAGGAQFRSVILPFIIFTGIWGSTWIVIRDQLGTVPPEWSVAYRFIIAAAAMALIARLKRRPLLLDRGGFIAAAVIGSAQFYGNYSSVYFAERHVTSGIVAVIFALLLIPNTLLGWVFLGQRPGRRFVAGSGLAMIGIVLLCIHELRSNPAPPADVLAGFGFTAAAILCASISNVYQAREQVRRHYLSSLLAWAMAIGALIDALLAWIRSGPPVFDPRPAYWIGLVYLAVFASALAFSLYYPVVRKIGPAKSAYSSVLVPVIAMALSTMFEHYRWTALAIAGALLTLAGMLLAMSRGRLVVQSPDAA